MKWIKLALAGTASWLAMTAHAQAHVIFTPLTYLLFAGPLGAVFTPGIIYAGLQIAAYTAVLGAQLALAARPRQPKIDPGQLKNTFQESETSEYNAIGRVRLGGLKAFGNTKGSFISRLVWHCKGPMVAVEEYHVGGRPVTVDPPNGAVSSPPWARQDTTYLHIQNKVGDGTETAWSQLVADFPNVWTSDHRARGVFQSLARYRVPPLDTESGNKLFQKLYQGGAPDIMVTARVGRVYDPRDPSQNPDEDPLNPATWQWSDNGILCAVHIMRSYPDLKSSDFDWAFIAAEADRADELVPTLTGTEPRARCWGVWPSENARGETMQEVLDSIGAEVVLSAEGKIRIRLIDDDPEAEIAFGSKHVTELVWKSGPEAIERPNLCRIKYYSQERGFDMAEINMSGIGWARVQEEIDLYGEKIFDVELPFCPSASQAQRIARRLFLQARADAGSIKTNMAGVAAWGVTYANIHDDDAEETMLCRIAAPRIDDEAGQVDIPYVVWPPALIEQPWDPLTMEAPAPEEVPDLQYESDIPQPARPSGAAVVQLPNNTYETRVQFSGVSGGTIPEANYRTVPGGQPTQWAAMEEIEFQNTYFGVVEENTVGERAEFRARFANSDGDVSYFSDTLVVDPMQIDNTPPVAPVVSVATRDYQPGDPVDIPAQITWSIRCLSLSVVRLDVTIAGVTTTINNVQPGTSYSVVRQYDNQPRTVFWSVRGLTTNGTQGAAQNGSASVNL